MNAMLPEKNDQQTEAEFAVADVEAGIRDFVRNDIAYLRKTPSILNSDTPDAAAEATVNNVNTLIQRVAGVTSNEIDNLIGELEELRAFMHQEGERVQRELGSFAKLSQTAMKSTRMIADSLAQWKRPSEE
ncbi:MAG: hypothetical protein K2W78_03190 [Xanthobacteraceae bacterium]|nr:hypothetical protein [Xanthobacteraceae bacterium]